jgi:hypothetical protein
VDAYERRNPYEQLTVAPTSRAPSGAGGGLQGSGDIGKLVRLVFSVWEGPLCAFCVQVIVLVTGDGRLGFRSPDVSLVTADSFSSPDNLGGGRRDVRSVFQVLLGSGSRCQLLRLLDSASRLAGEWCPDVGLDGRCFVFVPSGDLNVISFLPGS